MGTHRLGAVVAAVAMAGAACAGGSPETETLSSAAPTHDVAVEPAAAEPVGDTGVEEGEGPGDEGIEVHGHWRLDVVNEDGTHDRTVEFENALVVSGSEILAALLGRQYVAGEWLIYLESSGLQPCSNSTGDVRCQIRETFDSPSTGQFGSLTVDTSTVGILVLAGQATMGNDTSIDVVATAHLPCDSVWTPTECMTESPVGELLFTSKSADDDLSDDFEPAAVKAGQVVQVSVTLSFS